jgi:hypothetical protein
VLFHICLSMDQAWAKSSSTPWHDFADKAGDGTALLDQTFTEMAVYHRRIYQQYALTNGTYFLPVDEVRARQWVACLLGSKLFAYTQTGIATCSRFKREKPSNSREDQQLNERHVPRALPWKAPDFAAEQQACGTALTARILDAKNSLSISSRM